MRRVVFGSALVVAAGFAAWFAASLLAARYLVPPGSGLDGAATVAVTGFGAALAAMAGAVLVAWRASFKTLTTATIVALVCATLSAVILQGLIGERETDGSVVPGGPTVDPG